MKDFFNIYNLEVNDNYINIESFYLNKELKGDKKIYFKDHNNNKIVFNNLNKYYGKNNTLEGIQCQLKLKIKENSEYKLFVNEELFNWSNNQNKPLNFNDNTLCIFTKKFKITFLNNGLKIDKRLFLDKFKYNFSKVFFALKKYKFFPIFRFLKFKSKYILINDRVSEGNDNGEALFKYISLNDKELAKNTYYVIDKKSPKYNELKRIGKVLKFKSLKHKFIYLNSKVVATSYIGNGANVYNPFSDKEMEIYKDLIHKRIIFLQHGVMMTDFHLMFNRHRMAIDKFVVSTRKEYNRLLNEGYLYDENSLIKTCLPRYDLLENKCKNKILFFATWRKWLKANSEEEFLNTTYYKKISSFLQNEEVNLMLKKYNFTIDYVIHAELTKYYDCFKVLENSHINILRSKDIIYSDAFNTCNILITDYSIINFDVGYLKKPILYYQYDLNDFLSNHTNNGSTTFSYEEEGFGEIVYSEKELIKSLEEYLKTKCKIKQKYLNRVNKSFFYLDKNNSKRVCKYINEFCEDETKCYKFNNVQ